MNSRGTLNSSEIQNRQQQNAAARIFHEKILIHASKHENSFEIISFSRKSCFTTQFVRQAGTEEIADKERSTHALGATTLK